MGLSEKKFNLTMQCSLLKTLVVLLVFIKVLLGSSETSHAASLFDDYTFVKIAETSEDEFRIFQRFDLNNNGLVAFFAQTGLGSVPPEGIFVGGGGSITTLASSPLFPLGGGFLSINDKGTVAFTDQIAAEKIFLGDANGGGITELIGLGDTFSLLGNPSINNDGLVAFTADPAFGAITSQFGGDEGLFVTDGTITQAVVDFSGNPFRFFGNPELNDAGAIAFFGEQDLNHGLYVATGGTVTTIADVAGPFSSLPEPPFSKDSPSMNSHGLVVFQGKTDAGTSGIFLWQDGQLITFADDAGPYQFLSFRPTVNDDGDVLFLTGVEQETGADLAIFRGPDAALDRVIGIGDPLLGSIIQGNLSNPVLNNAGQFAFSARLADGRSVLVRADPLDDEPDPTGAPIPEPSTLCLLGSGLLALTGLGRRKKPLSP